MESMEIFRTTKNKELSSERKEKSSQKKFNYHTHASKSTCDILSKNNNYDNYKILFLLFLHLNFYSFSLIFFLNFLLNILDRQKSWDQMHFYSYIFYFFLMND